MTNCCGDNRFKIIEKAKEDILQSTNIEEDKDEMKVLDNFLFRCWQMGWLKKYETTKSPWISVKDDLPSFHSDLVENAIATKNVIVLLNDGRIRETQLLCGHWKEYDKKVTHWMRLPELPKE